MSLSTDDYDFELPQELIAQRPCESRTGARMLRVDRASGQIAHQRFTDLLALLQPGDLLVLNDTKVFPARLFGQKETGGKLECLVERICSERIAWVHLRSSNSPKAGAKVVFSPGISAQVLGRRGDLFELEFFIDRPLLEVLQQHAQLPLPPYIDRQPDERDMRRYQTVFADKVGAVAAPTAGLHFDQATMEQLRKKGVNLATITLHVGAGTFMPVRVSDVKSHRMHSEWIEVDAKVCQAIQAAKASGRRVVAVGTTVVRALESASRSGQCEVFKGDSDIFIYPGFQFGCVDALLTNFHLPKSTLLMLVSAFAGYSCIREAYASAVEKQYRFFSYGDCMLIM